MKNDDSIFLCQSDDEWVEWNRLTPSQRWAESELLFAEYLSLGGTLEPDQPPFPDETIAEHFLQVKNRLRIERKLRNKL